MSFMMLWPLLAIAAFLYYDLTVARRYFRNTRGRKSTFLRWWISKSLLKLSFIGGVLIVVSLALLFQGYTLVIPDFLSRITLPRTVRWGVYAALCVVLYIAIDLFRAWRCYLGNGRGRGTAGVRFYRWWLRKSVLKFCVVGGVACLALGGAWGVNRYHLLQAKSETSGYMAGAQRYYGEKKYREAILELRNAIKQNPGDHEAYLWLARCSWQLGDPLNARDAYREANRIEPRLYAAHLELSRLFFLMKEPEAAIKEAVQALTLAPEAPEPSLLLARIYNSIGRREQALEQCRAMVGKEFQPPELRTEFISLLMNLQAYGEVLQVTEAGLKKSPNELSLKQARALALELLGRVTEAEAALRKLATETTSPEPHLALGDLKVRRGEYIAALKEYEEALKQSPNHERAMNNFACLNAEHGFDMERSAPLAALLYAKHPREAAVADTLGWTLFRQGKIDEALPLLRQATEGMPGNPIHHYHLGVALLKSGRHSAGKRELSEALKISGTFDGAAKARELL